MFKKGKTKQKQFFLLLSRHTFFYGFYGTATLLTSRFT